MTAEEIRAEAVARLTAAIRATHHATDLADGMGGYQCACGGSWASRTLWGCRAWREAPETAGRYVDALGDLLPTGVQEKPDPTDWPPKYRPPWRRYTTDWKPVTE